MVADRVASDQMVDCVFITSNVYKTTSNDDEDDDDDKDRDGADDNRAKGFTERQTQEPAAWPKSHLPST